MICLKATHYGFRTVLLVCLNPSDPEYIHADGTAHPIENINGCQPEEGVMGVCRSNRIVQEFIFDGVDQYENGLLRTPESFWEEVCRCCAAIPAPEGIDALVGRTV